MNINPTSRDLVSPIGNRWSPYRFENRSVPVDDLAKCFEAAGWAASSFNEQPWRWIVATREETTEFERILGCLVEANQAWAADAGALILTAYRAKFARNDNPNRVAMHDLGQAAAHFALQAAALGLQVHQMAGVNLSQIRAEYSIPEDYEPATAIAVGFPDTSQPSSDAEQSLKDRELGARKRKPISDHVFHGTWGQSVGWK